MKCFIVALLLVTAAATLFADDAIVMPAGVFRARLTNSYASVSEGFDDSGERQEATELKMDILGIAFEMGLTQQITLGLQWAPGVNLWADIDAEDVEYMGTYPLFIGAKVQIIGEEGFIGSESSRLTVTPGLRLPLEKYDVEEAFENASAGDPYRIDSVGNEAFAIGGRLKYDYVFSDSFFINLYTEAIYNFPVERNLDFQSAYTAFVLSGYTSFPSGDYTYEYGTDVLFEIDPHYELSISDNHSLSFSLPTRYSIIPEVKIEGEVVSESGYKITLDPSVSYFNSASLIPWEVSLDYNFPVAGKNTLADSSLTVQMKMYAQFW